MSLTNIVTNIDLDVYDHDLTPTTVKAIALDGQTRYVAAALLWGRVPYDIGQGAGVILTVLRPDNTGVQVTGSTYAYDADGTTMYGAHAELSQLALAIKGTCKAQFKITSGDQILRTEIFSINNGAALDADIESWAGDLDGHNLDEMAESIETLESAVGTLQTDVATVKEGLQEYADIFTGDVDESVQNWLDEHPEATITVQDGAVTEAKLNSAVKEKLLSDYFYEEITSWQERLHDTTCYFVKIPVRDSDNNVINPYLKYESSLTPLQHAIANHTTFTCNGTTGCLQGGSIVRGHVISRGQSVYNNTLTDVKDTFRYVSINADRTVVDYPVNNTTQADMLENGAYNVFCAYYKLIENGIAVDNSETTDNEDRNVSTYFNSYYAFGVLEDNTLLFMAADGRTHIDKGLTSILASEIMLAKGCTDAWAMDGGGSVSYSVRGSKFNRNIDNNGMSDRLVHISLNFKKDSKSDAVTEAFGKIGEEKQNTVMQFIPYINDLYSRIDDNVEIPDNTDLNTITTVGRYAARGNASASTMTNSPTSVAFVLTIIKISSTITFHVLCDYNGDIYVRRNYVYSNANHYTAWKKVTLA